MKVSLITILDNTNFGTYLQALALSKTIEKLGLDVEIVDYIRPRMSRIGSMSWTRNPWKKLLKWLNYPAIEKLRDADHDFLKRFVALSPVTYSNYKQLKNNHRPGLSDLCQKLIHVFRRSRQSPPRLDHIRPVPLVCPRL